MSAFHPAARARALTVSWLAYATYYLGRKGFSVVKSSLARHHGLDTAQLALIDTVYLLAYAIGQIPSGMAADRWGARRIVAFGLFASALACAAFGASSAAWAFAICFAINGFAQSTGWPGTTKIVAEWTRSTDRGRVMGIWSTCYQVGGIAATALATWLLAQSGWRSAFYVPALVLAGAGVLVLAAVRRGDSALQPSAASTSSAQIRALLATPILYSYGACYFCVKLIRYSLLFWLPYYLHTAAGFDEIASGYLSTGFEVGGVLGSIVVGHLSDRPGRSRALVALLSLLGLAGAMYAYASVDSRSALWHFVALAVVGALLFGPDALLSGAAAQDAGGPQAAGTATGMVNAMGSAGAFLQGALTVGVERAYGWNALLLVFVGLSVAAGLCLLPALRLRAAPELNSETHNPAPPPG